MQMQGARRLLKRLSVIAGMVFFLTASAEAALIQEHKVYGLNGAVSGDTDSSWIVGLTWNSKSIGANPSNYGFRTKIWVYNENDELMYSNTNGGYCGCPGIWDTDGYVKEDWSGIQFSGSFTVAKNPEYSHVVIKKYAFKYSGFSTYEWLGDYAEVKLPEIGDYCELSEGNPINVSTGNNTYRKTDLTISTPSGEMMFTRTYNSLLGNTGDTVWGPLGYGWTFNYHHTLSVSGSSPNRTIRYRRQSQYPVAFEEGPENVFTHARAGAERYHLTSHGDGTFTLIGAEGGRIHFTDTIDDNARYLRADWMEDAQGRRLTLTYSAYQYDSFIDVEVLSQVVDEWGNGFGFEHEYDEDWMADGYSGRIAAVYILKAPSEKVVFTYSDRSTGWAGLNNLKHVTYPGGKTIHYFYEDPNNVNSLTSYTDEGGTKGYYYEYDEFNRAVKEYREGHQNYLAIEYNWKADPWNVLVKNYAGDAIRNYTAIETGNERVLMKTGLACCGSPGISTVYTYDSYTGNRLEIENGRGIKKQYSNHDSWGNAGTITEAVGTGEQRSRHYIYESTTNQLLAESQASVLGLGAKETIYDHDDPTDLADDPAIPNENPTPYLYKVIKKGFTRALDGTIAVAEHVTTYTYNAQGQRETIDGPRTDVRDVTAFSYYPDDPAEGNDRCMLYQETNALGYTVEYGDYTVSGKPGYVKDVNNVMTRYVYNWRGQVTDVRAAGGGAQGEDLITSYDYYGNGDLNYVRLAGSGVIDYDYDVAGRVCSITRREGPDDQSAAIDSIEYQYDSEGNRMAEILHEGEIIDEIKKSTTFDYDGYNRLRKLIHSDSTFQEYGYDAVGNRTSLIDEKQQETKYIFDALNRLMQAAAPGAVVTHYGYDSQDNLIQAVDPESTTTTYEYDDFSRLLAVNSADSGRTEYRYDAAGNVVYKKAGNNTVTQYTYDALNRLLTVDMPGSEEDIFYTYDSPHVSNGIGRLTGITDQSGTLAYYYDKRGHIVWEEKVMDGVTVTTGYEYDKDGNLSTIIYPSGRAVSYAHNEHGQVIQVEGRIDEISQTYAGTIAFHPFGPAQGYQLGNGLTVNLPRNLDYELTDIQAGSVMDRHYEYNDSGTVESISNLPIPPVGQAEQINYFYENNNNQLTGSTNGTQKSYQYDAAGSIIHEQIDGTLRAFDYNYHQRLWQVTENEMIRGEYTYDALGRRTKKVAGEIIRYYIYDIFGHLIEECDASGAWQKDYVYLNGQPLAMIVAETSEKIYYYLTDHLGTPQMMTDNAGRVVWEGVYLPFGKAQVDEDPDGNGIAVTNNLRFPGQYYDAETGLHYNWWRYYDPEVGRYLRADPIDVNQGINHLYVYVENNAINSVDPLGLKGCGPGSGALEAIIPERWPNVDFSNCCNDHDDCYGCEGKAHHKTRRDCDLQFCKCLFDECLRSGGFANPYSPCPSLTYCLFVIGFGEDSFRNARRCCP